MTALLSPIASLRFLFPFANLTRFVSTGCSRGVEGSVDVWVVLSGAGDPGGLVRGGVGGLCG